MNPPADGAAWLIPPQRVAVPRTYPFTPEWVTSALSKHFPGCVADKVLMDAPDPGTTTRCRLHVNYARGSGPERVFIKIQGRFAHRLLLGSMGLVTPEARLLGSGAPLPHEHPAVYAVGLDRRRLGSVIVMEDVTVRGAIPNIVYRPVGLEAVRRGIAQLARLHATYWNALPAALEWIRPWRIQLGWGALALISGLQGPPRLELNDALGLLPPSLRPWHRSLWLLRRGAELQRRGPQTLLHGDTHIGNTYLLPDGELGFVDLQVTCRGSWSRDIGYFITSALSVAERRAHEHELLRGYIAALQDKGVEVPPWSDMWDSYRSSPAYGIVAWLSTLGAKDYQQDAVSLAYIERFCAAYVDLDTETLLRT